MKIFILVCFAFFSLILLFPLPQNFLQQDFSTVVVDENDEILRVFLNKKQQWLFPPDKDLIIPEKLEKAVLCFEDKHFYKHFGVNPFSVLRAFYKNVKKRKITGGASTITMQLVRLTQPKSRTYTNKMIEIFQALKIELLYSKNEILQKYLLLAPYGRNIVGFETASLRYFQKFPKQLTWSEAAILAVLPNAPGLVSPTKNPELLFKKKNKLLKKLFENSVFNKETYELSLLEPVPEVFFPFETLAPHLAERLKRETNKPKIKTTINKKLQLTTEELTKQHVSYLSSKGIRNASAIVLETKTGKVKAYVGSQDFFDNRNYGKIDGVRSKRSSGSIFKPFLYALCFDAGKILPQTMLPDVPIFFGSFSPNNADKKFNGLISAKESLIRSLNIPSVQLLSDYGVYPFYVFLKSAGITTLFRSADDYGLPLVLGGAETTLWDVSRLFCGLGNGGNFGGLQVLAEEKPKEKIDLISPGASFLTLEILKELRRPGADFFWEQFEGSSPFAWKTGTSYGFRDAWAVGVSPEWVVAVWVGNFDGEANTNLAGASSAGSLLFEIFNSLPKKNWFKKPQNDLVSVQLCSESGFLACENCPESFFAEAPKFAKTLKNCPYHEIFFVTEKFEVCSLCWENESYGKKSFFVLPPQIAQFLREKGSFTEKILPHKPTCPQKSKKFQVQILYPQENSRLWVPRDFDGKLQKITLKVAHKDEKQTVFWYVDDVFYGSSKDKHTKAVEFSQGKHTLEVLDEAGNSDKKIFFVDLKK